MKTTSKSSPRRLRVPLMIVGGAVLPSATRTVALLTDAGFRDSLKVIMTWLSFGTSFWFGAGKVFLTTGDQVSVPTVNEERES